MDTQCTFHDKTCNTFHNGNCTFSLFLLTTNLIGFQEHLLTIIAFCKEPDKWTTSILIIFHIGCTWLGGCGSTNSDFLEFNRIEVDYNILSFSGYQTRVRQYGTITIPSAITRFTSERTLGMTEIRENA